MSAALLAEDAESQGPNFKDADSSRGSISDAASVSRGQSPPRKKFPRLSHRKSRYGCQRCKIRHVKCDETRPVCRHCSRHGVPCVYERLLPGKSTTKHTEDQRTTVTSSIDFPESRKRRLLEIRLMHHYTVSTTLTFPGCDDPCAINTWTNTIPKLAVEYTPLLSALLAISSLHLSRLDPSDVEVAGAHHSYFGSAIHEHRQAVAQLCDENADSACFTSIILAIQAFAMLQDRPILPYAPPLETFQIWTGIASVFTASLAYNPSEDSVVSQYLRRKSGVSVPDMIHERYRDTIPVLLSFQPGTASEKDWDETTEQAYVETACLLGSIQCALRRHEPIMTLSRRLMVFPTTLLPRFIELVHKRDPRALVILAHFFALAHSLRSIWWIAETPRREVIGLESLLPDEWKEAMKWPLEAVG